MISGKEPTMNVRRTMKRATVATAFAAISTASSSARPGPGTSAANNPTATVVIATARPSPTRPAAWSRSRDARVADVERETPVRGGVADCRDAEGYNVRDGHRDERPKGREEGRVGQGADGADDRE